MVDVVTGEQIASRRGALYYPYIHIHDENWLKTTLLCFRQVRRIVPYPFTSRDEGVVQKYSTLNGPDGPLLVEAKIHDQSVHEAQKKLKKQIETNFDEIVQRFQRKATPPELQSGPASFQIHRYKLLDSYDDPGLAKLLEDNYLAWHSSDERDERWDRADWLTMHPRLGAAVMSTLALAIEANEGLHIVTPSIRAHNTLLANREDQVFEALLEIPVASSDDELGKTVDEIAQIVITTGFDVTRLTPEDIQKLIADGRDLQKFRNALVSFSKEIPAGMGPLQRERRLREQAQTVLNDWRDYSEDLPSFIRQQLAETSLEKVAEKTAEKVLEGFPGGLAVGAVTHSLLAALPGIAISLLIVTGVKAYFKRKDSPMRFLNRIQKATDRSFGSLYVPQWSMLAGQSSRS